MKNLIFPLLLTFPAFAKEEEKSSASDDPIENELEAKFSNEFLQRFGRRDEAVDVFVLEMLLMTDDEINARLDDMQKRIQKGQELISDFAKLLGEDVIQTHVDMTLLKFDLGVASSAAIHHDGPQSAIAATSNVVKDSAHNAIKNASQIAANKGASALSAIENAKNATKKK